MRNLILAAASVAFLASAGSAFAATTEGTVTSVNAAAGELTLASGQTYKFQNAAVLNGVLPGQTVGVATDGAQGINVFNPQPAKIDNIDHN